MLNPFEALFVSYQKALLPLVQREASRFLDNAAWAIKDDTCLLESTLLLDAFILLNYWKTYEQNTFFTKYLPDGCPDWVYPSMVENTDMYDNCNNNITTDCCCKKPQQGGSGWIGLFNCSQVDIRDALYAAGVYPSGMIPDGISFMIIEATSNLCDDDDAFVVDKPRTNA